jgi:hypothetical protein
MSFAALRPLRLAASVAALGLLAACAQPFEARVQSFQSMPPIQGQTFAVKASDPSRDGSLEFQSYAQLVSEQMQKQGFRPAPAETADFIVKVDFGSGPPRERIATTPGSVGVGWNSWGWHGRGWVGYPWGWGAFYDPFWGPGWGQPEVYSFTIYPAFLDVDILRASDKTPVFEGRAETTTRVNDLPATMPKLVTAIFTDFPGASARSKVVRVPTGR